MYYAAFKLCFQLASNLLSTGFQLAFNRSLQPYGTAEGRDAAQMIRLLDTNNDGVVSYEEFRAYLSLLPAAGRGQAHHPCPLPQLNLEWLHVGLRVRYLRYMVHLRVVTRRYTGLKLSSRDGA